MVQQNIYFDINGTKLGLRNVDSEVYTDAILSKIGAAVVSDTDVVIYGAVARNTVKVNVAGEAGTGNTRQRVRRDLRVSPSALARALSELNGETTKFPNPSGSGSINGEIKSVSIPYNITVK